MISCFKYLLLFIACLITNVICVSAQKSILENQDPIFDIKINTEGRLFVLTNENVCAYAHGQNEAACFSLRSKADFVLPLLNDAFCVLNDNVISVISNNDIISQDSLSDIITDALFVDGLIYIATGKGLYFSDLNQMAFKLLAFENEFINSIDIKEEHIVVALDDGVALFSRNTKSVSRKNLSQIVNHICLLDNKTIVAFAEDNSIYYLNESLEIINKFDYKYRNLKSVITSFNEVYFLADDACFKIDKYLKLSLLMEGNFTSIIAFDQNLLLAKENAVLNYNLVTSVMEKDHVLFSLYTEKENQVWLGSNGKIELFEDEKLVREIVIADKNENKFVSTLVVSEKYVFAGTMGDGLYVFDKNGGLVKQVYSDLESSKNNIIQLKLMEDQIWVAYLNGISILNKNTFKVVNDFDKILNKNYLFCIEPISVDRFYLGTSHNGVIHYNSGSQEHFLEGHSIYSLEQTPMGMLVGTEKSGMFLIADGEVEKYYSGSAIQTIGALGKHVLFSDKRQVYLQNSESQTTIPLPLGELRNSQLNALSQNEDFAFFGFENGLLKIDKARVLTLDAIACELDPPLLYNAPIDLEKNEFDADENTFSFSFHNNSFFESDNAYFKYRLLGLDSTWQNTQQHNIDYFNLNPGEYTFEVSSGFSSDFNPVNLKSYAFKINKPFYLSLWFIGLVGAALLFMVWSFFKRREGVILNKEKQKQEKVKFELIQLKNQIDPHFLFNSLNSLIGLIEDDPRAAAKATQEISKLYRNILVYENVDLIPLHQEIELARSYFEIHKMRFDDLISLSCDLDKDAEGNVIPLSCQLLLENAIKHNVINQKNHLEISIKQVGKYLVVTNNINLKQSDKSQRSGLGLKNLQARYRYLNRNPFLINKGSDYFTVKIPIVYD